MKKIISYEISILDNWKDIKINEASLDIKFWCNNLVNKGILKRYNKMYILTKLGKEYKKEDNLLKLKNPKFTIKEIEWHEYVESL